MKTRSRGKSKAATLVGALFAIGVLKALVDGDPGGPDLSIDVAPVRGLFGSLIETGAIWGLAIPTGLYLLYLAFMKVAPAQMRQDHAERASKRTRKWVLISTVAFIALAYALHYAPIVLGTVAAGLGSAGGVVGANLTPILVTLVLAAYLLVGYLWAVRAESKSAQLARGGIVYSPLLALVLVLHAVGVIGS